MLYIIVFFISFIYLLPQIVLRQPNLLDIIETWSFGTNVVGNCIVEFYNAERFRPMYTLSHTMLNALFHYRSYLYFIALSILLAVTLFLLIRIANPKRSQWYVLVLPFMYFFISPVTVDTYWRLGTAEYVFAIFLLASVYYVLNNKYTYAILSIVCLMLSKETAIFYIPVFLIFLIWKKRFIESVILSITTIWYCIKMYYLAHFAVTHLERYTSLFTLDIQSVWDMLIYYGTAYYFYIVLLIISISLSVRRRVKSTEILLISLCISGYISLLIFHNKNWPYYFFPTLVTIIVYFTRELVLAAKRIRSWVLFISLMMFVVTKIPVQFYVRALYWHNDYIGDSALIEKIQKDISVTKYSFVQPYWGGQYQNALDYMYGKNSNSEKYSKSQFVILNIEINNNLATKLCAKNILHQDICKWSITSVSL
jgi:hypothetical protein